MKRNDILLGLLGLLLWGAAMPVQADTADELQDAAAVALQRLDQLAANEPVRLEAGAGMARKLAVQLNSAAAQSVPLNDQLKNRKSELEEKIGALDEQIKKLKEHVGKLDQIQEKITVLMPTLMNAGGDDDGVEASQHILAAIAQDRAKAARLADAIKQGNPDDVSSLLQRAFEGARVLVGSMSKGEGVTVNFRVGSLIHCLSTNKGCRGGTSSLGESESRKASNARVVQVQSLLSAATRETAMCNRTTEDVLSRLGSAQRGSAPISADQAAELQRLMGRLTSVQSTSSQLSRDVAAAMDRVIGRN